MHLTRFSHCSFQTNLIDWKFYSSKIEWIIMNKKKWENATDFNCLISVAFKLILSWFFPYGTQFYSNWKWRAVKQRESNFPCCRHLIYSWPWCDFKTRAHQYEKLTACHLTNEQNITSFVVCFHVFCFLFALRFVDNWTIWRNCYENKKEKRRRKRINRMLNNLSITRWIMVEMTRMEKKRKMKKEQKEPLNYTDSMEEKKIKWKIRLR